MAVTLSPVGGAAAQFFDNNGLPLSGGLLYTYAAGTSTPLATYTTISGNIANSNPIVLDSAGRVPNEIWITTGYGYKFVLQNSSGAQIWSYDNIPSNATSPFANDASSVAYEQGNSRTAGSFVVGVSYLITSIGTTNFVAIGAASNTVGITFTATGVGSGTGTAQTSRSVQNKFQETISVKDFGAVGDGTTDDYTAFVNAIAALPAKGGALYIPPTTTNIYRLSQTLSIRKPIHMYGDVMGANNTTGTTLYFDANVSGLVFGAYNTSLYTTITPDGALGSQYSVLENLLILSAGGATTVDGVVLRVQMTCRNVVARGFKRYGFRIYNTIGGGGSIEGDGNQWLLDNCKAILNGDYGFYVDGDDSNTGVANKCFAQLNGTYGFYDNSLIGNTYIGCDTAGNTTGSFYSNRASSAVTIIGLWEDGAGTSVLGSNVTSIGGNGGKITSASAGFHMASGVALNAPYKYQNATGTQTIGSFLGYKDTSMTAYAWGATSESAGLNAWTLKFDTTYNVWYTQYANSSTFQPIAYPNSSSALYTNKGFTGAIFQNGYAVKNSGTAYSSSLVRLLGTAAPVSGTYQQGDIVYNSAPVSTGYIGWVCTVAGTPGTWKTFGLIS
jgi:hypothetical protein